MEQITKPHCGARLDRLPDCRWHSSMFAIVAFGLLVCWSNAVGGLILAQLKALGWTDNSTTATFSAITTAGMFLGALVGGIIGGMLVCRFYKLDAWTLADLAVIGAPLALCLGRCANFVNGELWGKPTDLPWGVIFGGTAGDMPRHPSQLYEAFLEGIVLFCILQVLSRKKPLLPQGTFMGVFVMGYGIVRFLIEFVRVPDAQLGYLLGGVITMGQLLSLPLVIAGLVLIIFARHRNRPQRIYLDA